MNRIYEGLKHMCVLEPQAVASGTAADTDFVDACNVPELEFLVATGALAEGKKLTVGIYTSDAADGSNAVRMGEAVFTAEAALPSALAVASYRVAPEGGRYVGVKIEHDAGADLVCAVTASALARELPAENGWTLAV